jgi:hypothetical protein
MQTSEFNKTITAAQLNESMFKKFGTRINFNKYTREQLEDYRNLLRTKISQVEASSNFNDLLTNETYQKDKYVMTVINTKIKEMLGESKLAERKLTSAEKKKKEEIVKAIKRDNPEKRSGKGKSSAYAIATAQAKKTAEGTDMKTVESKKAKPDFLDMDKDGNKKEPMKKAVADKKVKEAEEKRAPAKKSERTATLPSGAKVKATKVQGWQSQRADKEAKKDSGLDEASKKAKKDYDGDGKVETNKDEVWGSRAKAAAKAGKPFKEAMKKCCCEEKGKKACPVHGKKMDETRAIFRNHVAIVNESLRALLREDEEGKAKAITAASDMVNDFTTWMQRVGQYQTKSMIELADSIRAEFGPQESEAFKQAVAPALASTIETLTSQREAISHAVAVLAGEATDMEPMGQDTGMEPDIGGEEIPPAGDDGMNMDDEFGASDAAAGGAETAGREIRESRRASRLAESHSLMRILSK